MPNHSWNVVRVRGTEEQCQAFIAACAGDEGVLDFNSFIPEPPEIVASTEANAKYQAWLLGDRSEPEPPKPADRGAAMPDWYEWRISNWGTKWNAYGLEEGWEGPFSDDEDWPHEEGLVSYQLRFTTAWSFPAGIGDAMVAKAESLSLTIRFWECNEDGGIRFDPVSHEWSNVYTELDVA